MGHFEDNDCLNQIQVIIPPVSATEDSKKAVGVITPTLEILAAENSNMKEDIECKLNLIMEYKSIVQEYSEKIEAELT